MRPFILPFLLIFCHMVEGQSNVVIQSNPTTGGNINIDGINFDGMSTVTNSKSKKPLYDGSPYLFEWQLGSLCTFAKDTIEDLTFRYDLVHKSLEIKYKDVVKIMPNEYIFSILTQNNTFLNSKGYVINHKPISLSGIIGLLYQDSSSFSLVSKTVVEIIKPNYYVHLDMGTQKSQIVQKKKYYLISSDNTLHEITKSKKQNLAIFGKQANTVANYMKKQKMSFKSEQDIIKLLEFFKTL